MKTSRIVKSAYRDAVKAGFKGSLKEWTRSLNVQHQYPAIKAWLANKTAQRKPSVSRRANKGHNDVHTMTDHRANYHALGSPSVSLRGSL